MTVYVDNFNVKYGRMIMCHMVSDTSEEELHEMAQKIGIDEKYYQFLHYDICLAKKKLAINNGAVEVTTREAAKLRKILLRKLLDERT